MTERATVRRSRAANDDEPGTTRSSGGSKPVPRAQFEKKTIALVYDFDGTLSPKPMQEYTFLPKIGEDPKAFWAEANGLARKHGADSLITYMHLMYKKAKERGVRIDREDLISLGRDVELFAGVEKWFDEIEEYVVELGTDGRLVLLQLEELMAGVEEDHLRLIDDYRGIDGASRDLIAQRLAELDTEELVDVVDVAAVLGHDADPGLDSGVRPRGLRLLSRIPRLPEPVAEAVVAHFGSLARIMRANLDELTDVEGVGDVRAQTIKEGLARLAEASILERYS